MTIHKQLPDLQHHDTYNESILHTKAREALLVLKTPFATLQSNNVLATEPLTCWLGPVRSGPVRSGNVRVKFECGSAKCKSSSSDNGSSSYDVHEWNLKMKARVRQETLLSIRIGIGRLSKVVAFQYMYLEY